MICRPLMWCAAQLKCWLAVSTTCVGLITVFLAPAPLWGQAAESASIQGKITDASGSPVPNVAVRVTGPALAVSQVTTATDSDGNYKLLDLPAPGVFRVSFALTGFQTVVREDIHLSVGFTARIDAELKVGAVTTTVEVSGANPVVDTVNTAASTNLQQEQLHTTPLGTTLQEMLPLATGVSMAGKPDVGDSNLAARSAVITYGVILEPTLNLEGINLTTSSDDNTGVYFDGFSVSEAEYKTSGNNADVAFPGVDQEVVIRSGTNSFHGQYLFAYESPDFQANNVTPALKAIGIAITNPIQHFWEYAADVGGRVMRDRLWFYFGASYVSVNQGQLAFVNGPDSAGCWTCGDAPPANIQTAEPGYNVRGDYQLNSKTKLVGVYMWANKTLSANGASATRPFPSTLSQYAPDTLYKGEIQSALTPHLYLDAMAGSGGYRVTYTPQSGTAVVGDPSSEELSNQLFTGPNSLPTVRPQFRDEAKGAITYLPGRHLIGGTHQLRFGTENTWEHSETTYPNQYPSGDYLLLFSKGQPSEIQFYNLPVTPINRLFSQAAYATDTFSVKRVTMNLGVRWERYHSFYPDENKPAGQFSVAAKVPGATTLTWTDVVPRAGVAWDLRGNGKTVIKGSFGLFGDTMGDLYAGTYNPDGLVTTTYKWAGPCAATAFKNVSYNSPNTSCDYVPGSVTMSPADNTNPAFVSATGGVNETINPNLKEDKTYEYVARIEREIVPNVAFAAGYVRHEVTNLYYSHEATTHSTASGVNLLQPYSNYTVPVAFVDALTGAPVTVWTYPAGVGGNQFELQNAPSSRPDTYNTFEVEVTKRYAKKWNAYAAYWTTKSHEWIQAIQQSPNDTQFPLDETWNWEVRANVAYNLPRSFVLSSYFRGQSGVPGQRTEVFSSSLLRQGSVTMRMEPFGSQRGPFISVLSAKIAKDFHLKESQTLEVNFEMFNLLNSSAATSTSYLTSTFNRVTGIISPFVGRVGAQFNF